MTELRQRIIAAAMEDAAEAGWYELRLHRVADRLGIGLPDLLAEFRDADAIADAWFAGALAAMLATPAETLEGLPASVRLEQVLMRWFRHQAEHRAVVAGMLRAKMHLSHPHHWAPAIFNLSRLMHWALEAARLDSRGIARQLEEVGLTLAFLRALADFARDDNELSRTRAALRRSLAPLDRLPRAPLR